jgi:2-(1,2-epoxy-1,2-dihydrophenyl)acetyl-CoA isomerase
LGLALEAVPAAEVFDRSVRMAGELAKGPTLAISMMKRQFTAAATQTLNDAMEFEYAIQALMSRTEDSASAVAAFANKHTAQFDGK